MHFNRLPDKGGFTLAELLVATTLISIVMLGVYTTFHSTILHWRNGSENEQTFSNARRIFTILAHDLSGVPSNRVGVDARENFWGDDSGFELITVIQPMDLDERALQRPMHVSYRLKGNMLIRVERTLEGPLMERSGMGIEVHRDRIELGEEFESIIADDVIDFKMTYIWTPEIFWEKDSNPTWVELDEYELADYRLPDGMTIELLLFDPAKDPRAPGTRFQKTFIFDGRSSRPPYEELQPEGEELDDGAGGFDDAA